MPIDKGIKKVLVLGSGPIEVGQAAEFDYAGTQACQALKEEGIEVVLVNSNPATIMTDPRIADQVYIEPLTCDVVAMVIQREQPDGILATTGGQTGLNLVGELTAAGVLERENVAVLGTNLQAIQRSEDRSEFRWTMENINQPIPASCIVHELVEAEAFAEQIGYPVVIRPAYTLGGSGGGFAHNAAELRTYVTSGLRLSPISQVLIEQSIAGMREVEYEVLRDGEGNCLIVCDMENVDPVGVHTGDSIVVAPCQTLKPLEKEMLEKVAVDIVQALDVVGSCNVQFALDKNEKYYVIEVNPRVSRSSALASKATGYPIAWVAAKISLGITMPEMDAFRRPAVDYIVTKIPRWPFDKFPTANRQLGTQMKATGEVMAIGSSFPESLQKAVRSLENDTISLFTDLYSSLPLDVLETRLRKADDERLFLLIEYLRRGGSVGELQLLTSIQPLFLEFLHDIVCFYQNLPNAKLTEELLWQAKQLGFSDEDIAAAKHCDCQSIRNLRVELAVRPSYLRIKTGGMPYYYSTYLPKKRVLPIGVQETKAVVVLGSGPIRIGQGIEFDYSTVHAAWVLREEGYQAVIINNNPETVSTDYLTSDRLYFEPLGEEEVWEIMQIEDPTGVMVQFGGQTAINLAEFLWQENVPIMGTTAQGIAGMEDREQFDRAMEQLDIPRPQGFTAKNPAQARELANNLTFPIVVRPSYVLGGRGMEVIGNRLALEEYLALVSQSRGWPLLMDSYLAGTEVEVDAVSDGEDVFIPGVMEHLERAGVHSGDSIAVFPAQSLSTAMVEQIYDYTKRIARHFQVKGFLNIQFVIVNQEAYVLEVNPRSSRTVPFLSKVTGVSLAALATKVTLGSSIEQLQLTGLQPSPPTIVSVKVPVFSFAKLQGMEITLGPEMKSTGEVMGRGKDLAKSLYKGFVAAKVDMPTIKRAIITVADRDKQEMLAIAQQMIDLGYTLTATEGTASALKQVGVSCRLVAKLDEGSDILDMLETGKVDLVINTFTQGKQPQRDGFRIRRAAVENGILCLTSLDTVKAYLKVVEDRQLWLEPLARSETHAIKA